MDWLRWTLLLILRYFSYLSKWGWWSVSAARFYLFYGKLVLPQTSSLCARFSKLKLFRVFRVFSVGRVVFSLAFSYDSRILRYMSTRSFSVLYFLMRATKYVHSVSMMLLDRRGRTAELKNL
jgi:hypothetical protein